MPDMGIVEYAATISWDNLYRNSCIPTSQEMRFNTLTIRVTIIKASSNIAVTASAADKSSFTPKDAAKLLLASLPRMLFTFSHSSISPDGRNKKGVDLEMD